MDGGIIKKVSIFSLAKNVEVFGFLLYGKQFVIQDANKTANDVGLWANNSWVALNTKCCIKIEAFGQWRVPKNAINFEHHANSGSVARIPQNWADRVPIFPLPLSHVPVELPVDVISKNEWSLKFSQMFTSQFCLLLNFLPLQKRRYDVSASGQKAKDATKCNDDSGPSDPVIRSLRRFSYLSLAIGFWGLALGSLGAALFSLYVWAIERRSGQLWGVSALIVVALVSCGLGILQWEHQQRDCDIFQHGQNCNTNSLDKQDKV
jgi:hypothetical protein